MRITISQFNVRASGFVEVTVDHRGQELKWHTDPYSRCWNPDQRNDSETVFGELNDYLKILPIESQDKIFEVYTKIHEILHANYDQINKPIADWLRVLFEAMDFDRLRIWAVTSNRINVPASVRMDYEPDASDDPNYKARTYLQKDYVELAALCVMIRAMVPIWGEYITRVKDKSGSLQKETSALRLLMRTGIHDTRQMQRLQVYINVTLDEALKRNGLSAAAVIGGMGSSELPIWMLAAVLVRRLTTCRISVNAEDQTHIVSTVYHYVTHTLRQIDKRVGKQFGGKITDKEPISTSDEDNKDSVAEAYKVKQEIPEGTVSVINFFATDTHDLGRRVEPNLEPARLEQCLRAGRILERTMILPHQLILTQWVLNKGIPARGLPLLYRPQMVRAICLAQAILWHWDFNEIAAMLTATPAQISQDNMLGFEQRRNPRTPRDQALDLAQLYPHALPARSKQMSFNMTNPAIRSVDTLLTTIGQRPLWETHCPPELYPEPNLSYSSTIFRPMLMDLVVSRLALR